MMKKLLSVLCIALAVLMTMPIVACGKSNSSGTGNSLFTGELESERGAVIKVMDNGVAIERGITKDLIAAFNEKYAGCGISAVDANMDSTDLAQDGPYGYGPDVLFGANDKLMPYAANKHILPLPANSLKCYKAIDENAWAAYEQSVDGVEYTFGIPVLIQAPVLYYNKSVLPENWQNEWDDDKDGTPDMVQYMNDLYAFSLQRKESSGGKKFGIMCSYVGAYNIVGFLYTYGGYTFGANNTDPSDIGHSAGSAEKGAYILRQLAAVMDERCVDASLGLVAYDNLGDGTFFAAISTPDVYSLFIDSLMSHGMSRQEAEANLGVASIPALPVSGNLTDASQGYLESKTMGGINGWAISSYTKYPNTCLAFIEFAAEYETVKKRCEVLGSVSARTDIAVDMGGLSMIVNDNLEKGNIIVQPSIKAVEQIWTPLSSLFTDIAKDPYRGVSEQKYTTLPKLKSALENCDQQIYNAIFTLS